MRKMMFAVARAALLMTPAIAFAAPIAGPHPPIAMLLPISKPLPIFKCRLKSSPSTTCVKPTAQARQDRARRYEPRQGLSRISVDSRY